MRKFITDKVESIKPSGIRRFFDIASEMEGVISLGVGEPDFDTPWHIREEGIYSLERGNTFYTSNAGLKELRKEVSNYVKRRFNLDYDPLNEVLITVGGSEAIDACFRACLDNGDEVIIPEPCYVSYAPCAKLAGAKVVTINLQEKNNFKLTKEELLNAITPKTKILVLAFPNNPTGSIMEKSGLEDIAKIAIEKDILVLSDEIYGELTYGATANWNAQRDLVGLKTHLYVYIDYIVEDGIAYPGFKFGDGQAYLIDLPFVSGNEATSGAVYVDTTANWNAKPQLIGKTNHVYVYSDYFMIDGMGVPGMKIGDGMAYLIDLPFVSGNDTRLNEHIADTEVHITNAERLFWNNKVTCFMSNGDEENIVFTKDNV